MTQSRSLVPRKILNLFFSGPSPLTMGVTRRKASRFRAEARPVATWFGNFSYVSKHSHGSQKHFLDVTALEEFDLVISFDEGATFSIIRTQPGMKFYSCQYEPFLTDEEDMPPLQASKCPCCNSLGTINREGLEPVHLQTTDAE
jgi:hypothetical protein